jgi:hypothetical protein
MARACFLRMVTLVRTTAGLSLLRTQNWSGWTTTRIPSRSARRPTLERLAAISRRIPVPSGSSLMGNSDDVMRYRRMPRRAQNVSIRCRRCKLSQ